MFVAALFLTAALSASLPAYVAGVEMEKFVGEFLKIDCKGEKVNTQAANNLAQKNCKKEIKMGWGCGLGCFFKASGLLEDDYQFFKNGNEAMDRMVNTKVYSKKFAKLLVDKLSDSKCESKFPSKGTDDCKKALKGTACLAMVLNKGCGFSWAKLISVGLSEI